MHLKSLRSKVFLLVGATLCMVAIATILVSQRDVRRAVVGGEELAVRNILTLLEKDTEARWGGLLSDKIATVRQGRAHLIQLGTTVKSVLDMYHEQIERGDISRPKAQALAIQWINRLKLNQEGFSFVFNRDMNVIASGNPDMLDLNLSQLRDFKGRILASSAYEEARNSGQSFAIYRWPQDGRLRDRELRYAYFGYFEPWDWIFAISGNAKTIAAQFDQRRQEMKTAVSETLATLQLTTSGFAFILDEDGRPMPALTDDEAAALNGHDKHSGKTLLTMLRDQPKNNERIRTLRFEPKASNGPWQISSAYFKPLKWTIVAAVPVRDLTRAAHRLSSRLLVLFLAVLAASLTVAWLLSARIIRPLHQLADYARALPEQDLSLAANTPAHIRRLPERQPDEVGRLAQTFMYMDAQLREKIARLVSETSSRERLESELNIARSIQMGLLPPSPGAALLERLDLHVFMHPAKEVGGDLYDYFHLADGRLYFAVGDVSDKGVPAALFMAFTHTLIRAWVEDEPDPARLMTRINDRLAENNPRLMFTTLALGVLDMSTGALQWASAGHPPLLVIQPDGTLRPLEGRSGPACGVQEGLSYQGFATVLAPGDCIVGYTDGVTEAFSPAGELYGEARLYALLATQGGRDTAHVMRALLDDLRSFAQDTEQSDDITLLAVRRPAAAHPEGPA